MKKSIIRGIPGFFLILIVIVIAVSDMLSPVRIFSENENRLLAQKPEFSAESLFDGSYTADYETYLTDQFVMRDDWITLKTYAERAALKKDINGVYFGSGGYLLEKKDSSEVDTELLKKNMDRLETFITDNAGNDSLLSVYAMLVPTSADILSDRLPAFATGYDQEELINTVADRVGENFINVRDVLKEHSSEYIYYRTDHHWTSLGAYYAYAQWAKACGFEPNPLGYFTRESVSLDFLGTYASKLNLSTVPDKIDLYSSKTNYSVLYNLGSDMTGRPLAAQNTLYNRDALNTKDKYTVFLRGNNAIVDITNSDKQSEGNGRRLLLVKDSYAHSFAPFAAEHFERTVMVDLRYTNIPLSDIISDYGITDILFLYNTTNFSEEKTLLNLTK